MGHFLCNMCKASLVLNNNWYGPHFYILRSQKNESSVDPTLSETISNYTPHILPHLSHLLNNTISFRKKYKFQFEHVILGLKQKIPPPL